MKYFLSFFFLVLPLMVNAEAVEIDGIWYNLIAKGKIAEVTKSPSQSYSGEIKIPEKIAHEGVEYDVTTIGDYSFNHCEGLISVIIPNSVTKIAISAFGGCSALTSVKIPNSVTDIDDYAFQKCKSLENIDIPNSVTTIGYWAFAFCEKLATITIPNSVTKINPEAFIGCTNLISATLSSNLTSIGSGVFSRCSALSSIVIPNSVSRIGNYAFENCSSLSTITIGSNVAAIGSTAFGNCKGLADVYCYAEKVPGAEANAFEGSFPEYATLHVPKGCVKAYNSSTPWNLFKEIVSMGGSTYTLTYKIDGEVYKTYKIDYGVEINPEPEPQREGYTFSGWSGIPAIMPENDVTVTGSFIINKYKLIYSIDGVEYKKFDIEYGANITPEANPQKEGYTFSGWSEIPKTMPAKDITISGSFTINKYKLTYKVDGVVYKEYYVEYGTKITPEPTPSKEGYSFSGWSEIPKTMPAYDIVIEGYYTTGITNVDMQDSIIMIHNIKGNKVSTLSKGVNIIRFRNGKIQKRIVK